MKIKYIAWKQVISSDVNRLIYGTQGPGLHNKADQAIQNFNSLDENPGLWRGFTENTPIPEKPGINIPLKNSVNPLNIWYSINPARKNPVKINHEIWDRNGEHAKRIIEPWYLGYMRILKKLLQQIIERDGVHTQANILFEYVSSRLTQDIEIRTNILKWIYDTQDGFCNMHIDTSFMCNNNIKDLTAFIEKYFYLVVKCENKGKTFNMALMACTDSKDLHPSIKTYLDSNKFGGEYVNIDVSTASTSPDAQRFLDALYSHRNIILYGPPGTGKTHLLTELKQSFNSQILFDDLDTEAPFRLTGNSGDTAQEWCTFHPNYSYESFVYGLEPNILPGNQLGFKSHIGPMLKMAKKAESGVKSLLIIDEINRANTSEVFGNSIAIIDPTITESIVLPHPIIDENGESIECFKSSENLFIVGTMNSLDKSTTPLSLELKRRFYIVEISPNVEVLRNHLAQNTTISSKLSDFACSCMNVINEKIHDYCGKEYELGQGYFWGLVNAHEHHETVLAEILRNKIIPHLKDILPAEAISEFFGSDNLDSLYVSNDYGFEFAECDQLSDLEILQAFSRMINFDIVFESTPNNDAYDSIEEYERDKIAFIQEQLDLYKNVIISGCSGTGKTYYISKILQSGNYADFAKSYWHSSTEYSDIIEGISASTVGSNINYSIRPGVVKKLAESKVPGRKLMIFENITKSNAAENFGELITLLEPDKRTLSVAGYSGAIKIPEEMDFLCTMTLGAGNTKLDSALKRRFSIIEFAPDYKALELHYQVTESPISIEDIYEFTSKQIKCLAIGLLRMLNKKLKNYIGSNFQIGQASIWNLTNNCSLSELIKEVDANIISIIEDYCSDDELIRKIFGNDNPILKQHNYGIEIGRLSELSSDDLIDAFRGMLENA